MISPTAAITFLTYEDMDAGDHFYREVLGLPLIEDQGWTKVYRIHGAAHVGIVEARRGPVERPVGSGTLLSLVVEDVDAWYERLKNEPSIEVLNEPSMVLDIPVYSFFITDPAGYRIEIQAFTNPNTKARFKSCQAGYYSAGPRHAATRKLVANCPLHISSEHTMCSRGCLYIFWRSLRSGVIPSPDLPRRVRHN
jgi:lactoylglutathione lyase